MKTIEILPKEVDLKEFIKRSALREDFDELINYDCIITSNGVPKILYMKLPDEATQYLRASVRKIKYTSQKRTAGLKTTSQIFGYNPRNVIRKDFCSSTSLSVTNPVENDIVCGFGEFLSEIYKKYFPEVFENHSLIVNDKILPEWKLGSTPFTSGIINKNNPLKYHFDSGNIKGVLSNMVVFKHGINGGFLSCPEYNIGFEVADNTVILFDGQNIVHGVTPIKKLLLDGYRYSIVYYTLKQMWNCLTIDEELIRARKVRANREKKKTINYN